MEKQRRQIKIFEEIGIPELQSQVNDFLKTLDSGAIVNISISSVPGDRGYIGYSTVMVDYIIMKGKTDEDIS